MKSVQMRMTIKYESMEKRRGGGIQIFLLLTNLMRRLSETDLLLVCLCMIFERNEYKRVGCDVHRPTYHIIRAFLLDLVFLVLLLAFGI